MGLVRGYTDIINPQNVLPASSMATPNSAFTTLATATVGDNLFAEYVITTSEVTSLQVQVNSDERSIRLAGSGLTGNEIILRNTNLPLSKPWGVQTFSYRVEVNGNTGGVSCDGYIASSTQNRSFQQVPVVSSSRTQGCYVDVSQANSDVPGYIRITLVANGDFDIVISDVSVINGEYRHPPRDIIPTGPDFGDLVYKNLTLSSGMSVGGNLELGTYEYPHLLYDAEDIQNIGYADDDRSAPSWATGNKLKYRSWKLNHYYKQMNDIDLAGFNFKRILHFSGQYDGQNFEIQNLTMNYPGVSGIGMFYIPDHAFTFGDYSNIERDLLFRDMTFTNPYIRGHATCGVLVSDCYNSLMYNIHAYNVDISCTSNEVGGLIGYHRSGYHQVGWDLHVHSGNIISTGDNVGGVAGRSFKWGSRGRHFNYSNAATVQGSNNVGGIMGRCSYNAHFFNCHNYGNITATGPNAAGIAANQSASEFFYECSNSGNITGETIAAGIAIRRANHIRLHNCWSTGQIEAHGVDGQAWGLSNWCQYYYNNFFTGTLVGDYRGILRCRYTSGGGVALFDSDLVGFTSPDPDGLGLSNMMGTPKTSAELKDLSTYPSFNIARESDYWGEIWVMSDSDGVDHARLGSTVLDFYPFPSTDRIRRVSVKSSNPGTFSGSLGATDTTITLPDSVKLTAGFMVINGVYYDLMDQSQAKVDTSGTNTVITFPAPGVATTYLVVRL